MRPPTPCDLRSPLPSASRPMSMTWKRDQKPQIRLPISRIDSPTRRNLFLLRKERSAASSPKLILSSQGSSGSVYRYAPSLPAISRPRSNKTPQEKEPLHGRGRGHDWTAPLYHRWRHAFKLAQNRRASGPAKRKPPTMDRTEKTKGGQPYLLSLKRQELIYLPGVSHGCVCRNH